MRLVREIEVLRWRAASATGCPHAWPRGPRSSPERWSRPASALATCDREPVEVALDRLCALADSWTVAPADRRCALAGQEAVCVQVSRANDRRSPSTTVAGASVGR